jgi:Asparagine synthase
MHSSVEVRYPFLDEDVFDFLAKLRPRWKLRGFRDKHLLRLLAERWLPPCVYRRGKVIFRAPLDSFYIAPEPPFVGQLLSEESLRRTGISTSRRCATGGKPFARCGPVHCRVSRWKWDSWLSWRRNSGITCSSAARCRTCPRGQALPRQGSQYRRLDQS